ncbi:MAG TPA: energy transducer TonB [Pyrinomonadaceae bacterium]|nr:energy transducer TonB [Pyrinomonadaceae bacterium]
MNKIISLLYVFLIVFSADLSTFAQEAQNASVKKDWVTVKSDDEKLAVDFPADFIVDTETNEYDRISRLVGFNNGVIMEMVTYKAAAKSRFFSAPTNFSGAETITFKKEDFDGMRRTYKDLSGYTRTYYTLGNKKGVYSILVRVPNGKLAEAERFLFSIKLGGKPLFVNPKEQPTASKTVLLGSLKSSPEVLEALKSKPEKKTIKITTQDIVPESIPLDFEGLTSIPIVIESNRIGQLPRDSLRVLPNGGEFIAYAKVSVLENGSVGEVWLYSNSGEDYAKACIEAVKKAKFIPAMKNGKPVDSFEIMEFKMIVFSFTNR